MTATAVAIQIAVSGCLFVARTMTAVSILVRRLKLFESLILLALCALVSVRSEESDENLPVEALDDESCVNTERPRQCDVLERCDNIGGSIYRHGGSARAYKPNVPPKQSVCDITKRSKPRVATWPFSRGTRGCDAPILHIRGTIWSCSMENDQCCCDSVATDQNEQPTVEVWQARPDGTYSSVASDTDEECRATVGTVESTFEFDTLPPGSTGLFGGQGPFGWESPPYGAPVIHFLITAPYHEPLLTRMPMIFDRSLQQSSFWGPDFRGESLASSKVRHRTTYELSSWVIEGNEIQVDLDFFLTKADHPEWDLEKALCPSPIYGLPSSFFFEPIALCAPAMLDFFEL